MKFMIEMFIDIKLFGFWFLSFLFLGLSLILSLLNSCVLLGLGILIFRLDFFLQLVSTIRRCFSSSRLNLASSSYSFGFSGSFSVAAFTGDEALVLEVAPLVLVGRSSKGFLTCIRIIYPSSNL